MVSSHNVRVASPNEALAQAVLNGEPVVPFEVVREDGQRSFLDVRRPRRERERERDKKKKQKTPMKYQPHMQFQVICHQFRKMTKMIGIFGRGFLMEKRGKKKMQK